jgi:signal transduction histidine kinase
MGNAVKFTPEGGRVTVDVRTENDTVIVRVQDTGVGIAADFLPRIFEAFTQAVNPLTERPRGLGLGLAIARHLVELQGGTLEAASPGVGRGATFTMRLPLLRVPEPAEQAP